MRDYDWLTLAAGPRECPLDDGTSLILLTSRQLLEAKAESLALEAEGHDPALCANACLVARAWVQDDQPRYPHGRAVLEGQEPAAIEALARRWAKFRRRADPGLGTHPDRVEDLKSTLADLPQERLKWKILRAFRVLPTEARAQAMTGRDHLWCALHLLLDREEELDRLCPICRAEAERETCPMCGRETGVTVRGENPSFDLARFHALKEEGGGTP